MRGVLAPLAVAIAVLGASASQADISRSDGSALDEGMQMAQFVHGPALSQARSGISGGAETDGELPAAAVLLVTALVGVGFLDWRRRRTLDA